MDPRDDAAMPSPPIAAPVSVPALPDVAPAPMRERRRVLFLAAGVAILFTFADVLALGGFAVVPFLVRCFWAASILACAWAWPRVGPRGDRALAFLVGGTTPLFFVALVALTGGAASPQFHFVLAMPLVVAVILQDHPWATLLAVLVMLASGVLVQLAGGIGAQTTIEWTVQAAGMGALAVYASLAYHRLRARERVLVVDKLTAEAATREQEEAVRARDRFLAVVAHELRTPLTTLGLALGLARRALEVDPVGGGGGGKAHDALATVEVQADRLAALVERVLDTARIGDGVFRLSPEPVDVSAFVAELRPRLDGVMSGGAPFDVVVDRAGEGRWDKTALAQVLVHLVGNAGKYGAGKPVRLVVGGDDDVATFTVVDRGIGIAREDQERIFRRGERAVSDRNYGGLGLGLWIARELVRRMGGDLKVESAAGAGATFTATLPRVSPGVR